MAKKKQVKKPVRKVKIDEDLVRKVDSLVDEIERTNNLKKITDEDIEELESTLVTKKVESVEEDTIEILGETQKIDIEEKPKKKKDKEEDLNITNSFEFKFDDERLRQVDNLDTSFLEGRINKKSKKKIKKIVEEEPKEVKEFNFDKFRIPVIIALLIIFAISLVGFGSLLQVNSMRQEKIREEQEKLEAEKKKEEEKVQSHFLFVGDKFTMDYDVETAFSDYHFAISGHNDLSTGELKDNLRKYIYNYNPSKVFIQVGIVDLLTTENEEDLKIVENIDAIIKGIKDKRPYAEIYIESIYPINDSDDDKIDYELIKKLYNNKIVKINNGIKDVCKKNKVTYLDVFSALYDKNDKTLKLDYTTDGFNLSEQGYRVVTKKIFEHIDF